ncbi:DNA-binding transcriptional MerR regulator [Arcanobacterium pluranimalium]|uniref:transcriptional regulator FtsR n=1 Tax=Arcanobacterium pluranimalium TaxID=108028 RepID=UPI00195E6C08|nr:MerR family transcriptional regulator [Arcanobacterium pluranimalium]MBM7825414.1 DNA-binding transcriptional MerR regulator [Arcanobacterium pluranimalium]
MTPEVKAELFHEERLTWPQDVSHEPTLKIGEVLAALNSEFPFLAASKIRYYESLELIQPHRTDSNQRMFSYADIERLRFILVEQRDRYTRLPQIKEMLKQLDSGEVHSEHPGKMRVVRENDVHTPRPGTRLHKDELAALTGASTTEIEGFIAAGLLTQDSRGRLTAQAVDIVRYALMLTEVGVDIRSLKSVRTSAHAHAVNLVNLLANERAKKNSVAKERVIVETGELSTMLTNYYRALLLESIDVELR